VSKCGVILCECNGAVERRISLQELSYFIHNVAPDLDIVLGNNLCEPRELNLLLDKAQVHPTVIGACNAIQSKTHIWQDIDDTKLNPCFTKIVNLLGEIDSRFSSAEVSDRVKLLVCSQISRAFSCGDISRDNLRTHFSPSQHEITRRDLPSALLPRYEIVPSILTDDCLGNSCKLCVGVCPVGAIADSDGTLKIDKSACTGCGTCVNACPQGAVSYPGYSVAELEREIEGLLSKDVRLSNRILAIVCESCLNADDISRVAISPSMFTVKVPSLAIISPLLMLNAFNMGADGIVLIHDEENCSSKTSVESLNKTAHFVQLLLDRWQIDKKRIKYVNKANSNDAALCSELHRFTEMAIELGHTPFHSMSGSMTFEGMYSLAAIIKEMDTKLQLLDKGILADECVPFGSVNIDQSHCTGCSVCAQSCPTGAISTQISDDSSNLKLNFQHNKCIACGICISICPEKCIRSRKVLDFAKLSDLKETIFENDFVICHNCSKPYATKSMIAILKHKLEKAGVFSTEWTEYCPSCRTAIQQKR
jgi:ferredoxin